MTNNFQSLSLPKEDEIEEEDDDEDEDTPSEEDGPAVKIPDHLQVQSTECSHLSFGSFGSGMNAPFSGSFGSRAVKSNEEAAVSVDTPSAVHSEARYAKCSNLTLHLMYVIMMMSYIYLFVVSVEILNTTRMNISELLQM